MVNFNTTSCAHSVKHSVHLVAHGTVKLDHPGSECIYGNPGIELNSVLNLPPSETAAFRIFGFHMEHAGMMGCGNQDLKCLVQQLHEHRVYIS